MFMPPASSISQCFLAGVSFKYLSSIDVKHDCLGFRCSERALHHVHCIITVLILNALLVKSGSPPPIRGVGTSTRMKMMKPHLVVAALFAVISADPAWAAQPFDGAWAVSVTPLTGTCQSYTWDIDIAGGRIGTAANTLVKGSGSVSRGGVVSVSFVYGSAAVNAHGRARGSTARGRWKAPLLGCAGVWQASRH
jgi:hypothetical protein